MPWSFVEFTNLRKCQSTQPSLNNKFHNTFVNLRCKSSVAPVLEKLLNFETTCYFRHFEATCYYPHFSHFMNLCISAVLTGWNVCCAMKRVVCWSIYLAALLLKPIQELSTAHPMPRPSVKVASYIVQLATLTSSLYYIMFCNFREGSAYQGSSTRSMLSLR